jgi:hypothetical protein
MHLRDRLLIELKALLGRGGRPALVVPVDRHLERAGGDRHLLAAGDVDDLLGVDLGEAVVRLDDDVLALLGLPGRGRAAGRADDHVAAARGHAVLSGRLVPADAVGGHHVAARARGRRSADEAEAGLHARRRLAEGDDGGHAVGHVEVDVVLRPAGDPDVVDALRVRALLAEAEDRRLERHHRGEPLRPRRRLGDLGTVLHLDRLADVRVGQRRRARHLELVADGTGFVAKAHLDLSFRVSSGGLRTRRGYPTRSGRPTASRSPTSPGSSCAGSAPRRR